MSEAIADIDILGMILAYSLLAVVITFTTIRSVDVNKNIASSVFAMSVQLVIAGFVLKYILKLNLWYLTMCLVLITYILSTRIVLKKTEIKFPNILEMVFLSISIGSSVILLFMMVLVVRPTNLADAQYIIPLAGMITGNSMKGCALALDRFYSSVKSQRKQIETKLSLGATRDEAISDSFSESYKGALLPTISAISGMGAVHLPGMMTGQILSGVDPLIAIKYQIAIMMAILSAIAITAYIILMLSSKRAINEYDQINSSMFLKK